MRCVLASLLLAVAGWCSAAEELVGFSKDMLAEDEAGLWMVVEKQEQEIRTSSIHVDNFELNQRIQETLCSMIGDGCSYLRPYIIRAPGFNAFMMPNGAFFIQTGLLLRARNDSQLAAVIGHEASHYFRNHTLESVRKQHRTGNAFAVLGALVTAAGAVSMGSANNPQAYSNRADMTVAAMDMLQAAHILAVFQLLSYERGMESEADQDGVKWMTGAGFDPEQAVSLWQDLIEEEKAGGNEAGFSLLNTHPAPKQRINDIRKLIAGAGEADAPQSPIGSRRGITALVDQFRDDWLVDELRVLHPDQFKHLLSMQVAHGYPEGAAAYLEGVSYKEMAAKAPSGKRKKAFYENAIAAFDRSIELGGAEAKPEAYRELGKLHEATGSNEQAKAAYRAYINAAPAAWDAKFIERKANSL